jgi:purine-nucleoside phosphorylase
MDYITQINEATDFLKQYIEAPIDLAIILGSGLGPLADHMKASHIIKYEEIPHFPTSTIPGHEGCLYIGTLGHKTILAMKGRVHYYEGYSMQEVTFPIRVFSKLKIKKLILTNACGGISEELAPGDLAYLTDQMTLFCPSPLRGPNLDSFGPRFVDMSEVYDKSMITVAQEAAKSVSIPLKPSVYAYFKGPRFETPADILALKVLGADTVGMSTVPEAIVARHCGMALLGLSLVTNKAAGLSQQKLSHQEVEEMAALSSAKFVTLVSAIIKAL